MAKQNDDGTRSIELRVEVPGTPEEVWQLIATGRGISTWFTPTTLEERVDGAVCFDLAPGMQSTGKVTQWEPFRVIGYVESDWSEGAPPLATQFIIEPLSGGKCVVRLVHSLFTDRSDWDDQLEGFENGWLGIFPILRAMATYFRVADASPVRLVGVSKESEVEAWKKIESMLGLAGAAVGKRQRVATPDGNSIEGEVLEVGFPKSPHQVLLRVDKPWRGLASLGAYDIGSCVFVIIFLVACGDDGQETSKASVELWQPWLDQHFPASM